MLFKAELADKIFKGQKTQTRRVVKLGEHWQISPPFLKTVCCPNGRIKWQVDRDYAVQIKRGGIGIGRIRITEITKERVCDITDDDAIAEGFNNRDEFFDVWRKINGKNFDMTAECWVIRFYTMDLAW